MTHRSLRAGSVAGMLLLLAGLALTGCGKKAGGILFPNQRPTVELTNAPVQADRSNPYFYAYRVNWSGNDPDGKIDHYEYCIDPAPGDSVWVSTKKNEEIIFFRASQPDPVTGRGLPTASDFHVFVIKAVDDNKPVGAESPRKDRAFYSFTIAPTVAILNPLPSALLRAQVTPSVRIDWTGSDPDGQFSQKPVQYKYRMIDLSDPDNQIFLSVPDSLRRREVATNWAGWDSTSADTQFVQFTNLTPGKSYLFVVIGFDEAGAYSPVFSLNSNMLQLTAGFASANGPKIHIFNQYIDFVYQSGGYSTDPLRWINIEVPSRIPISVGWEAFPTAGSRIQGFRWMLDGNVNDETPRSDENTDLIHWSQSSPTMPNLTTLPGMRDGDHFFYLECSDNNGQKSLGVLHMIVVTPSFNRELLVLDDTRLEVDKFSAGGCPGVYTLSWPARSEFDTLLFAKGNFPWRCTKNPTTGVVTRPGLFAGYSYDTLGTRLGLENAANSALLSTIGRYRNLVWLVDARGAQFSGDSDQGIQPVTALFSMSGPGRASTLAAYVQLGGRVWLAGGGGAYASLIQFNKKANDQGQTTVFSSTPPQLGELAASRIMFDGAHWQSAIAVTKGSINTFRYEFTVFSGPSNTNPVTHVVRPAWSHFNPFTGTTLGSPNYSRLPAEMRYPTPDLEPLPPTRLSSQAGLFYQGSFPCEYLLQNNSILEDINPDADAVTLASVLDTLYEAQGVVLLTTAVPPRTLPRAPTMTYYHGNQANQFVFTGFAFWNYVRSDAIGLVDFVLQDIWGLTRNTSIDRGSIAPSIRNGGSSPARIVTPAQRTVSARVPASGTTRE